VSIELTGLNEIIDHKSSFASKISS